MLDFIHIKKYEKNKSKTIVYPDFIVTPSTKDLMIRGGSFYAVWDEEAGLWTKNLYRMMEMVDKEVEEVYMKCCQSGAMDGMGYVPQYMKYESSGLLHKFNKFTKDCVDTWSPLDQKPIFKSDVVKRSDFASFRLQYDIDPEERNIEMYDTMMSTLYSVQERRKIEWAIGCCLSGDASRIQKFIALYGGPGTGKSTVLNILNSLLPGYCTSFDAAALGNKSAQFALEPFTNDPIVGIQHDADMSKITDNTKFNSVVSHESMTTNEKFRKSYNKTFNTFLFIGTNSPIKITEARSGLSRRLIDVTPTGNVLDVQTYRSAVASVDYALGAIAHRCIKVYKSFGADYYNNYRPTKMMELTNDIYAFIEDNYFLLRDKEYVTLAYMWDLYKRFVDDAGIPYKMKRRDLANELQYYFKDFAVDRHLADGTHLRSVYSGFKVELFDSSFQSSEASPLPYFLKLSGGPSYFDQTHQDCYAQLADEDDKPIQKWDNVTTTLSDIDTKKVHYVRIPKNEVVIDFDLKDDQGNKSIERNIEAARNWPATYAETSKSGNALHLHYIYDGDVSKLSRIYAPDIEVKVFNGKSSLRRKLTLCNNVEIATISSGLPLKEEKAMVSEKEIKSERSLRSLMKRAMGKEIHDFTRPNIDFIKHILDEAYQSGLTYDVTDMYTQVLAFAGNSSHQAEYCVSVVSNMHFKSKDKEEEIKKPAEPIGEMMQPPKGRLVFFDIEVFPNLVLICWKAEGDGNPVMRMFNPSPDEVKDFVLSFDLVGYNNRKYDNHILMGLIQGLNNAEIYRLSQKLIDNDPSAYFMTAWDASYTDVFDFVSKKQSLKRWESELGISHKENEFPWYEPVAEKNWVKVAEYCDNDVLATEAVFNACRGDFLAREILADLAGGTVNDTTNSLTAKIIFGNDKNPQSQFNYRFLGDKPDGDSFTYKEAIDYALGKIKKPKGKPWFPGYTFEYGVSTYRGEKIGEGGKVYADPGMYSDIDTEDVTSMHPNSVNNEMLFGPIYTPRFYSLVETRVAIKHGDYDSARTLFDGKLAKYLDDPKYAGAISSALKIAINSVYGLTSASFDNRFRDKRNKDNIVAKRGALMMTDLKYAVTEQGYHVVHIKTDSIKVEHADDKIISFIRRFGEAYGYTFETEAKYSKFCLVNDAVYIAKESGGKHDGKWTATGTQFQVPYVFKTLFSKEPIQFDDLCELKSIKEGTAMFLDMNENYPDISNAEKELDLINQIQKAAESNDKDKKEKLLARYLKIYGEPSASRKDELLEEISKGHNYVFVGKNGRFCPIIPGYGGGWLVREKDGKYSAVTGTKGFRWMESENVKLLDKERYIDRTYYNILVDKAVETITKYGDFEWFVS
jgi:energy-coupling factor transporter ATP-binding protein EcfA2